MKTSPLAYYKTYQREQDYHQQQQRYARKLQFQELGYAVAVVGLVVAIVCTALYQSTTQHNPDAADYQVERANLSYRK